MTTTDARKRLAESAGAKPDTIEFNREILAQFAKAIREVGESLIAEATDQASSFNEIAEVIEERLADE